MTIGALLPPPPEVVGVAALGLAALSAADVAGADGVGAAEFCATAMLGAVGAGVGAELAGCALGSCSSMVVTTGPGSADALAGAVEGIGTGALCERMAPNTATHTTMTSAHAIDASRMAGLQAESSTDRAQTALRL